MIHPAQGMQRGTNQEYLQSQSAVIKEARAKTDNKLHLDTHTIGVSPNS